jgi:hypothetical protein
MRKVLGKIWRSPVLQCFIPAKVFLKLEFKRKLGYSLNLKSPKSFNEKLQWLKLYNQKPEHTMIADKYAVRKYIAEKIGEEYLILLLGVWDKPEEIDFDTLPNEFVLKCNHNSGLGMYICKDKAAMNKEKVIDGLWKGLRQDYYLTGREWPYKNIPRKIICEKYLTDEEGIGELTDYKFFCFDGYVDCVMIATERQSGCPKFYFFNDKWELLRLNIRGKEAPAGFTVPKPSCIDEMFRIASILSKGFPFVRVDLYESNKKVYFGELTLYPQSGFDANILPEADEYWGGLLDIDNVKRI